jgi:hypothetical protein
MAGNQLPQPGGGQRDQTKFIVFENFEKMNTQAIRQSLSEKELAWLENLQPIAPNNMTTVPAPGNSVGTVGATSYSEFYASIGGTDYLIIFTTDGAGWSYNLTLATVGQWAPPGTFSNPDVTTREASRLLINDPTAGYSTWDGTLFVHQGGVSPNITVTNGGSGYGSPPTVTISGGSGTGATAVAVVNNGTITAINLTNPGRGYQATDVLTVTIGTSPGSGAAGHVTMTGFSVASLSLVSGGSALISGGTFPLAFTGGGGTGAAGFAVFNLSGNVAAVALTTPGSGYTSAPAVTVSGVSFQTNPIIVANLGTESVATIVRDAGGTLYTAPPAVTITPSNGLGSGAAATATESGGSVTALALNASAVTTLFIAVQGVSTSPPGTYSLAFSGGGGTGAAGTVTIGSYTNNVGTTSVGVISTILTSGGSNYTTAPTVSMTGATFTSSPTIQAFIASQGAGYTLTPAVIIGSGTGAAAIAHVWPYVPAGNTLAVFQGRVWLNGLNTVSGEFNLLQWTGTGATYGNVGYDDFLEADASGSLILSDADLVHAITALRSYNNYLFIMGDQAVKQIGNISLNAAGTVTLFTILTLSSDQGTIYPKSCISYNRVFMFANQNGIYGVFGSSVQKLSSDMDGIWRLVNFSQSPQGAVVDINAIHNAVFLIRYVDPLSSTRSILLTFDGKRWFVTSQGNSVACITTSASLATGAITLYSSSGTDVTPLFAIPNAPINWKIQSALTHHGNAVQGKKVVRAGFSGSSAQNLVIIMTVDTEVANGPQHVIDVKTGFQVFGGSNDANNEPIGAAGIYLGVTLIGLAAGFTPTAFTATNMLVEYQETSLWKGA